MKKNLIEKINTGFSSLALLVSGIALWFSFYTYNKSREEKLVFVVKPIIENYTTKVFRLGKNVVIPLYWDLTMSNNSEKSLSIVSVNAECVDGNGVVMYSKMFNGLFTEVEQEASLPINLNSGESRKYLLSLGVLCDSLPSDIIIRKLSTITFDNSERGNWTRLNIIKKLLAEHNTDYYGNKSNGQFDGEKILTYQVNPQKQQTFNINFTTSNKVVFSKRIQLYSNED